MAPFRDQRGATLILTAIMLPVMLMVVGFAGDYGYASYINQRLARAADAAALAAVSQNAATMAGGYDDISWLQTLGSHIFYENVRLLPTSGASTNISVASDGNGGVIATATYRYAVPTFFSGFFGLNTIPVSGSVQATAKPLTYANYYILVDASQSMGVGATDSDMSALYNRVVANNSGSNGETGCVFGCHNRVTTNQGSTQTISNEDLAHQSPAITLRIDSAVAAIQNIIATAANAAGTGANIQIGLYTIQADPNTGKYMAPVMSPSANYPLLTAAAATITLGNNNSSSRGDTDFIDELSYFSSKVLPANGSGSTAASPANYVILISDGVNDVYDSACIKGHCRKVTALDPATCNSVKSKSTLAVIYTTYLPIYHNNNVANGFETVYNDLVYPIRNQIVPNLQNCASSTDFYFEAQDGPAITAGMQNLFQKTLTSARLTK